ncbi:MAG: sugar-binding domain-containing protein [Bacteroidota bacterium]
MRYIVVVLYMVMVIPCFAQQEGLSKPSSNQSFFLTSSTTQGGKYNWKIEKVDKAGADGAVISSARYKAGKWLDAVVPGTILTSLVHNKVYPDPYWGDLNRRSNNIIPDIADAGREFYHYWYRSSFSIPQTFEGKRVWIKLHGINYKSNVWFNGKKLGSLNGMFNTRSFDITDLVSRKQLNVIAIDVSPVDVTGSSGPKNQKSNGAVGENSNGGNGEIGRNVTMLMSVGWDFTLPDGVRDRNTGIWRDVEVYATGNVVLENPFVQTKLPLPDTSSAEQTVSVELFNATKSMQKGLVKGTIKEIGTSFQEEVVLQPNERKTIIFSADKHKALNLSKPKLWWPINKGKQNLYNLQLSFSQGNQISHVKNVRYGVREITSDQNTPDKSRRFLVNGYPVFIRGTNWIPEAMLRNSVKRTHAELTYTKQAGLNLLRLWGGGIAESDYFFDKCDELGFLVWNEYWLTGDTQFPTDVPLYLENIESTVKRIRNHASLAYHVSSNESTEIKGAANLIKSLDPSRGYQMQSECCGVHDGSPYKYENPMQYFENTASKRGSRVDGFNPEYGTPCLPTVESLREMMPASDLWPINKKVWDYMDGNGFHQVTTKYTDAVNQFGQSNSIEEFAKKAQFVGALNFRAIWEVWNYNKFGFGDRWASGFLFWYHNSPTRQTGGRMYDWSLEPTAALYYSQDGLEPLHAQYDYLKNTVSVYNDYRKEFKGYQLSADVYDIHSRKISTKAVKIEIPADGLLKDAIKLEFPETLSQVHFIKLMLKDTDGKLISDSFYWRSNDKYQGAWTMTGPAISGFHSIKDLGKAALTVTASFVGIGKVNVTVSNPSDVISFFTQLKLQSANGKSLSPSFYTDNFFNLLPGESKKVTITYSREDVKNGRVILITDGFNIAVPIQHEYKFKP